MAAASSSADSGSSPKTYKYDAFLSHEGTEKPGIIATLLGRLNDANLLGRVYFDEYARRGGALDETIESKLTEALRQSRKLIVVISPEFIKHKWTFWELRTFLNMMESDYKSNPHEPNKRELFPVFYRISARSCKTLAKEDPGSELVKTHLAVNPLHLEGSVSIKDMQNVLEVTTGILGIDAYKANRHLNDHEVVTGILKEAFDMHF